MKPAVVCASVHEDLDSKLEKYPKLIEHCKALVSGYVNETELSVDNPQVRIVRPVVGWIDSGLPLDEVIAFEVQGNQFIFTIRNAPPTPEQMRNIRA
jgi:hypothetical protein